MLYLSAFDTKGVNLCVNSVLINIQSVQAHSQNFEFHQHNIGIAMLILIKTQVASNKISSNQEKVISQNEYLGWMLLFCILVEDNSLISIEDKF